MKRSSSTLITGCVAIALVASCGGIGQAGPLYANTFETEEALAGWLPLGGTWGLGADETSILQQQDPNCRGAARLVRLSANYEVDAAVRPLMFSGQWGCGLVAYWQPGQGCYRLSNFGGVLGLWRETPAGADALAAVRMDLKSQGYRMRLSVHNEGGQSEDAPPVTVLRAKVWAIGEVEPQGWLITAQDLNQPLRFGRAGLFTGRASAAFTDFAVTPLLPADQAWARAPRPLDVGTWWHFIGGNWESAEGTLRQTLEGNAPGFHASAYAVAAGWANHTVSVSARADEGSRNQGFGLSAYWMEEGDQYQLGQVNGTNLVLARRTPDGDLRDLGAAPFTFDRGQWYRLKLELRDERTGVRLRGKAWPMRAGEPMQWQIEALDEAGPPLLGGEIGLWCIDDVCSFDDLQVTAP